jgi:hypothetical protein
MAALERGWIPKGSLNDVKVQNACAREDSGDFKCVVKKGQIDQVVHDAVAYALDVQNLTDTKDGQAVLNLSGSALHDAANTILGDFFDKYRHTGATCDFGGVAMLIESNLTLSDDDSIYYGDDEYFQVIVHEGPNWWIMALIGVGIALVAGLFGFILAMRYSPSFNRKVRQTTVFRPLTASKSHLVRSSLALPALEDYDELDSLVRKSDDF